MKLSEPLWIIFYRNWITTAACTKGLQDIQDTVQFQLWNIQQCVPTFTDCEFQRFSDWLVPSAVAKELKQTSRVKGRAQTQLDPVKGKTALRTKIRVGKFVSLVSVWVTESAVFSL